MLTRVVREVPTFLLAHVSIRLNTYRHVRSKTRSTPQTPSLTRTRTQIKVQFSNSKSHVALATVVLLGVGVCVSQEECWMMKSGREQKVLQQKPSENDSPATTFFCFAAMTSSHYVFRRILGGKRHHYISEIIA